MPTPLNDTTPVTKEAPSVGATIAHGSEADGTRDLDVPTHPPSGKTFHTSEIPGYRIEGEIARGGMGAVLAAHDLTLNREVAIKVMLDATRSEIAKARFLRESQITAQLPHPGIPPIHALGTLSDGSPYLVMKLVRGKTLAELLECRRAATDDLPRLVQIFEQIALAVGFAHAQRIVHRDLKPLNVMVGAFGEVQVMDWGLAKSVDGRDETDPSVAVRESTSDITQSGAIVGTPAYMAPEQARGENVDARTDVFALGGVLCHLLTGKPAFAGASALEALKRAANAELADAFARLDSCGADTELVALAKRCLSQSSDDRPADGQSVAMAVAAYRSSVDDRLRIAERNRAAEVAKATEQRKRRRVQLALAASVALLAFGSGAFAWWQDRQAAKRELRDRDESNRLARNVEALEEELSRCETALQNDQTNAAASALTDIERRLAEGGADHLRSRIDRCRKDLILLMKLDEIDNLDWMPSKREANRIKQMTRGWATALGDYGITPGQVTPAEAADLLINSSVRDRLLATLELWLLIDRSPDLRAILAAADPDPSRDAVRSLLFERKGKGLAALVLKILASDQPVWFLRTLGRTPVLPIELQRPLLEKALVRQPADLITLMALGGLYPLNQKEGAEQRARWYQAAVAANPRNLMSWMHLGISLADQDDYTGAIAAYREAIKLDPTFALAHNNLGIALKKKGDLAGAIAEYRLAVHLDPKNAIVHVNLSGALLSQSDMAGAIAAGREAVRLDAQLAIAHFNLGIALDMNKDRDGAISSYKEAVRINPDHASAHFNLAQILFGNGDVDDAVVAYRAAIRADPKYTSAYTGLGLALWKKGDSEAAIVAYQEAVRLDPKEALALTNLAALYFAKEQYHDAAQSARAATAANPKFANAYAVLGLSLLVSGDVPEARLALNEAARLNAKQYRKELARLPPLETEQMAMWPLDQIFRLDALKIAGAIDLRLGVQIARKQLPDAIATADRFAEWTETLGPVRRTYFYLSALYFARCASIAIDEREMLVDRTVGQLRKAKEHGYFSAKIGATLQNNRVFRSIRTHPKFIAFLKELEPPRELLPAPKT